MDGWGFGFLCFLDVDARFVTLCWGLLFLGAILTL
jgi:hypothetical protein